MSETEHCHYFVQRKKRYCRMTVKKGNKYCGEHQLNLPDIQLHSEYIKDKRVECPLDPTHTCYQSRLAKHLTVCNTKKLNDTQPTYIIKGIHLEDTSLDPEHQQLSALDQSLIDTVINKINVAYEKLPQFPQIVLKQNILNTKLNDQCGTTVRKHLLQNASLLAHLQSAGLIRDDTCFIEFGAGKGKLTYWLGRIIKEKQNSCILLIDRSTHRHKNDNKLKNEQSSLLVKRIRADIADLKLNAIPDIQKFHYKVAVAKHLCGVATDLTLKCLLNAVQTEPKFHVAGLVIAFCCHHRCLYSLYVGKKYLEQCGFMPQEFPILCSIASWATCSGQNKLHSQKESIGTDTDQRTIIGRRVKTILNWGRVTFLNDLGFQSKLIYYTTPDVSLENMCIVANKVLE